MENVTTRMSEEELALIERLEAEEGMSRSDIIRKLIRTGAREELLRVAFRRYQEGEIGLRGVARLTDLTIPEIMHEANKRNVMTNYDEAALETDVEALR